MKTIYKLLVVALLGTGFTSCNDEWTDEQYKQQISIKSDPGSLGVTDVHIRYTKNAKYTYNLPVIVSGSTDNSSDKLVSFSLRTDTLDILNFQKFGNRPKLYFQQLPKRYYSFPDNINIPMGVNQALLPIEFTLDDIDDAKKWALPIKVDEAPNGGYEVNNRKHYRTAILRPILFNEFSGKYSGTQLLGVMEGESNVKFNSTEMRAYVVTDSIVFFYAGQRTEDYEDRDLYKVFFQFTSEKVDEKKEEYKMKIWVENDKLKFQSKSTPTYKVSSEMDATKTYLKHVYITISNIEFDFVDYTSVPSSELKYNMKGSLSVSRDLDTRIPDEDQTTDSKWW